MSYKIHIADDETFVEGRSKEKAAELLELAKESGQQRRVRTTTNGYIVPTSILDGGGKHAAEDGETEEQKAEREQAEADEAARKEQEEADRLAAEAAAANATAVFDPAEHDVDEVTAYLAEADDDERSRVLAAEKDGKARKTVLASENKGDK